MMAKERWHDAMLKSAMAMERCFEHRPIAHFNGYEGLNKDMFFRIKNDSITRGHSLALVKSHSRLDNFIRNTRSPRG